MTAPIPVRVLRHKCPHCPRTATRPVRVREHMARCWYNPAARGCKTCAHFEQDPGDAEIGLVGGESCDVGVSLAGRPACGRCGGANWLPTGETFRPRFATGGPVYAQCPDCGGNGAEVKPGPIVHCDSWKEAA